MSTILLGAIIKTIGSCSESRHDHAAFALIAAFDDPATDAPTPRVRQLQCVGAHPSITGRPASRRKTRVCFHAGQTDRWPDLFPPTEIMSLTAAPCDLH
jgi:hypothetical protein